LLSARRCFQDWCSFWPVFFRKILGFFFLGNISNLSIVSLILLAHRHVRESDHPNSQIPNEPTFEEEANGIIRTNSTKQLQIVDVIHHGRPNVPKSELAERLSKMYKTDAANCVLFGFRTAFGGGKSTGFALIYDDQSALKEFEPKYRLVRVRSLSSSLIDC
jgi:ribosomal protein S24E